MYNIAYEYAGVTKYYLAVACVKAMADHYLANFKLRYLNADGTGKAYPNGKGYYPITNPRLVRI